MTSAVCCGCGKAVAEGLRFKDVSICTACESKILSSQAGKIDYEYWVSVCRKLWTRLNEDE